jgi:hypothetical protein
MGGRVRWAVFVALLSVVLAVGVGFAALSYSDDGVAATPDMPIEGSYTFASTNIVLDTPFAGRTEIVITGGRLAIGGNGHVFWRLQMHSKADNSKTGRLSCQGSLDSGKRTVTPAPRYQYDGFAPDLSNAMIQHSVYESYCAGSGLDRPDSRPLEVVLKGELLELEGRGGAIVWRRE